jgi:hypothetical protein
MNREDAKATLLVRAVELTDRNGMLLPLAARDKCTDNASRAKEPSGREGSGKTLTEAEQGFVARRAALLTAEIAHHSPGLNSLNEAFDASPRFVPFVFGGAVLLGFSAAISWVSGNLNLLALPFYGLVLWNFGVYAWLLYAALRPKPAQPSTGPIRGVATYWLKRISNRMVRGTFDDIVHDPKVNLAREAASRFLRDWVPVESRLTNDRAIQILHASSALLSLGIVLGVLGFGIPGYGPLAESVVGWRTQFPSIMTPDRAHIVLSIIFGPAALVTSIPVPDADAIAALKIGPDYQGGSAETWLVLIVVSLLLYIVIPRTALWWWTSRRILARREEFYFPTRADPYFRALIQTTRGRGQVTGVLWHNLVLAPEQKTRLRAALREALGGLVQLDFMGPVSFGQETTILKTLGQEDHRDRWAVLFSIADTPEDEVQGELLRQLSAYGSPGYEAPPVVVVDLAPYERFRQDAAFRQHFDERLQGWRQFVVDHGGQAVWLDPSVATAPPTEPT